jgi:hypothetical protein
MKYISLARNQIAYSNMLSGEEWGKYSEREISKEEVYIKHSLV